jgi:hypothetical protein
MQITIKEPIPEKVNPRDSFVVDIVLMSGDGDAYNTISSSLFKRGVHDRHLISFLETLFRIDVAFPNGRSGRDHYDGIFGFLQWCSEGYDFEYMKKKHSNLIDEHGLEAYDELFELSEELWVEWENDPYHGGDSFSKTLESFKVRYFDESGIEHEVEIAR